MRYCAAIRRDPHTIVCSTQVRVNLADLEETRKRVRDYALAGITHLILSLHAPYPDGIVHRLDEEIIRPVKEDCEG